MIKRLKARRSHGTLVANPRRKKSSHKRRSLSAFARNPKRHRKVRNGRKLSSFLKRGKRKSRNPHMAIGGVDLVSVGVGSVAAIALGAIGQGIFDKYLQDKVSSEPLAKAAPSLIVAAASWAAHKYVKNQKIKDIAKVTLVLSIFKAIDDSVGKVVTDSVKKALPGVTSSGYGDYTSGAYIPALKGVSGAYMDNMGGAYMHTSGILPGAGLYGL